jgi:hypothetical protein
MRRKTLLLLLESGGAGEVSLSHSGPSDEHRSFEKDLLEIADMERGIRGASSPESLSHSSPRLSDPDSSSEDDLDEDEEKSDSSGGSFTLRDQKIEWEDDEEDEIDDPPLRRIW